MYLFYSFMKDFSTTALGKRLCLKSTSSTLIKEKEKMFRPDQKLLPYLLQTYVTDDVIAMTSTALLQYIQRLTMWPKICNVIVSKFIACWKP